MREEVVGRVGTRHRNHCLDFGHLRCDVLRFSLPGRRNNRWREGKEGCRESSQSECQTPTIGCSVARTLITDPFVQTVVIKRGVPEAMQVAHVQLQPRPVASLSREGQRRGPCKCCTRCDRPIQPPSRRHIQDTARCARSPYASARFASCTPSTFGAACAADDRGAPRQCAPVDHGTTSATCPGPHCDEKSGSSPAQGSAGRPQTAESLAPRVLQMENA